MLQLNRAVGIWLTVLPFRAANDEELFEDSPEEYIRRDLEGSDAHTRRRSACNLVYALCEAFEGPVIDNFARYINHLLTEYANAVAAVATNNNSNSVAGNRIVPMAGWSNKDCALLLVTSLAAKGKTEKVSGIAMGEQDERFFRIMHFCFSPEVWGHFLLEIGGHSKFF